MTPTLLQTQAGTGATVLVAVLDHGLDAARVRQLMADLISATEPVPAARATAIERHPLVVGDLQMDLARVQVGIGGRSVNLTHQEFRLLQCFMEHPGRVLSRAQLLEQAWGLADGGLGRTVDVHVRRLRVKLARGSTRINTVRGFGYRLDPQPKVWAAGVSA